MDEGGGNTRLPLKLATLEMIKASAVRAEAFGRLVAGAVFSICLLRIARIRAA